MNSVCVANCSTNKKNLKTKTFEVLKFISLNKLKKPRLFQPIFQACYKQLADSRLV